MRFLEEAFARQTRDAGDRLAVWSRGEGLRRTFAELDEKAAWLAPHFGSSQLGLIALALPNGLAFIESALALFRCGRPFLLLSSGSCPDETIGLARRLGASEVLLAAAATDQDQKLADGLFRHRIVAARETLLPPATALIKLTSGSTGEPKGACFRPEALAHGIGQIASGMEIKPEDRVLLSIPLNHSYGFDNGVLSLIALGTPLILESNFFPQALLRAWRESEATFVPLVPPLVRSLGVATWPVLPQPWRAICAGGVLLPEVADDFRRASGKSVHNFFGSTETGGISFENDPDDPAARATVGRPLPGVELTIAADGALTVASRANLHGFVGEDACAEVREVKTGDLATFTPEGRLRLIGRSSDFLNIGGRKIAAAQIETELRRLDGVVDAVALGLPDQARGDRVVAFLVTQRWPIDVSPLPPILQPRELHRLDALPLTDRGKLDRSRLRSLILGPPDS